MIASAPLWAVLVVAALLTVFTVVAVAADALLGAWAAGRRVTGAALTAPLVEVLRLLAAQPRPTPAADGLLWRLGLAVVPVAGVLSAVVIRSATRLRAPRPSRWAGPSRWRCT